MGNGVVGSVVTCVGGNVGSGVGTDVGISTVLDVYSTLHLRSINVTKADATSPGFAANQTSDGELEKAQNPRSLLPLLPLKMSTKVLDALLFKPQGGKSGDKSKRPLLANSLKLSMLKKYRMLSLSSISSTRSKEIMGLGKTMSHKSGGVGDMV